jgi:N-acetylneuraminic acid mutarotase
MYVFGGNTGKDSNDLFSVDLESYVWAKVTPAPSTASNNIPSPRYGHAAALNPQTNQMIVAGGCKQNSIYFQDSYSYDLNTNTWKKLADIPVDLAYHSLTYYNGSIYLFGGYNGEKYWDNIGIHMIYMNHSC